MNYGRIISYLVPYTNAVISGRMAAPMSREAEDLINGVEIVEPPIQELKKRGRWMTTACFSGTGCVVIFVIGLILGVKSFIGVGPKQIKNLPSNFPSDIPLYDQYNIDKITFIPGRYKSRSIELAALFPKIALSPLIFSEQAGKAAPKEKTGVLKELLRVLIKPVADSRDMVQVEWFNISSKPEEMTEYYQNKLKNNNFIIDSETIGESYRKFTFRRDDSLSGTFYVETGENNKIDYAFIIVNLPPPVQTDSGEQTLSPTTNTEHAAI